MMPKVPAFPPNLDFTGHSILVTGANSGLGFASALHYLQLKASTLYLLVRSLEKGEQAKKELLADPLVQKNNPKADIHIYQVDLASLDSLRSFSKKFFNEVQALNVAVLNAGVGYFNYNPTIDKMESTFQVNYLSNAILTSYLVPILKQSALTTGRPSHLTIVSSMMQNRTSFGENTIPQSESVFDWFNDPKNMGVSRYGQSKILATAYANEAASRVDPAQVVVNSMCPGFVKTGFDVNSPGFIKYPMKILRSLLARSTEEGARAIVLATITGPEGSGKFFTDGAVTPPASFLLTSEGQKFQKRMWDETQERLRAVDLNLPVLEISN
ncbi:hypothetical protein TWF694_001549 [Orbilia ellipsospora]|uniref:NAD(P)-binding protein n=1 Tax=Orbilia ellipsospora TaxID=2528407 RepID=A0AAV9XS05_9PEZI